MAQQTKSLEELIRDLPEDLRQETKDFVEFLMEKRGQPTGKLSRKWRGILRDMRDEYPSSVDLQHTITNEWRDEDIT